MSHRFITPVLAVVLASVLVGAQSAAAEDANSGGALRIAIGQEPGSLEPAAQTAGNEGINAANEMVETLVTGYSPTKTAQPELATSWEGSPDGKTWTFHLRKGVKFQDGTDFNAQAVKFNFDRVLDPKLKVPALNYFNFVKSTTVVDDYTVRVELSASIGFFPNVLDNYNTGILSPASITAYGNTYERVVHPVGTGPYVFKEYIKGVRVVMDRNDNYWGVKPAFKELEFRIAPDAEAREALLRSGGVDIALSPPPSDLPSLQADPNFKILAQPTERVVFIIINTQDRQQPLLQDVRVRQALNYAIDKVGIIKSVLFGLADPLEGPVASDVPGFCKPGDYSYDPAKAKDLLQQAGAVGMHVKLQSSNGRYLQDFQAAQAIAGNLRDVGVIVDGPTTADFPSYYSTIVQPLDKTKASLSLLSSGGAGLYRDTGPALGAFETRSFPPAGLNASFYTNATVDSTIAAANAMPDRVVAAEQYCTAMKQIWADAPWIFLWTQRGYLAYSAKVKGLSILQNEMLYLNGAAPI